MRRTLLLTIATLCSTGLLGACVEDAPKAEGEPDESGISVDSLGSADHAGSLFEGAIGVGDRVESDLTDSLPYRYWLFDNDGSSTVFVDAASREGGDTFLLVYERQRNGRFRLSTWNDDCRGSLNSCDTLDLGQGAYLFLVSSYSYITYGDPAAMSFELALVCEGGDCDESGQGVGETCSGIAALECASGLECNFGNNVGCHIADMGGVCVDPNEPVACYEIYAPECGCDGVTYSNDCMRESAGVPLDYRGACRTSDGHGVDEMCGGIAGFRCADGLVCNMAGSGCGADMAGVCEHETAILCTADYVPVCGCDGRTYGNDCVRRQHNVGLAHPGECAE